MVDQWDWMPDGIAESPVQTWPEAGVSVCVVPSLDVYPSRVLVTGGTGSFGNAFARRVLDCDLFEQVVIYSRDELKQQAMRRKFDDARLRFFLGDVRDAARLTRAMQGVDAVVHAAALKQVDRSAEAFDEFVKTNIMGAMNVVEACHAARVTRCVALSTDKAVEATTPYGVSKAAAEWLFIGGNAWGRCKFALCRYGNIVGSRGSVKAVLDDGGEVTLTDERMTRFWLDIDDAVDLVLLALKRMRGGEVFIPKDVRRERVRDTLERWCPGAYITVTGKRSYEKFTELLVAREEVDRCHDCEDVYVLTPHDWRWEPGPYGVDAPLVPPSFCYSSNPDCPVVGDDEMEVGE